jgi:putative membrane protein
VSVWVWTVDPFQLIPLAVALVAYVRRARTLRLRGRPVPRVRQAAFYGGIALLLVAFVSPIDYLGEERLFLVHMIQHLLIGDLAAVLIVLGLTGPILRPLLALPFVGSLRALAHPFVALPLWVVNLLLWHLPPLYQGALDAEAVHALEHVLFFAAGALMWSALIEPLPGPAWFGAGWKVVYILVVRLAETVLANVFIWSGQVFYPHYARVEPLWGIGPVQDQSIGGIIMMVEGSFVTFGAFAWLFLRWMSEGEARDRLVEQGVDPARATRMVRYGRHEEVPER